MTTRLYRSPLFRQHDPGPGHPEKIARLPHTNGLKNRVVIQKVHHYHYEHVPTIVGTSAASTPI